MTTLEEMSPRAAAKKGQVLMAARRLFTARGFAGTSMEAVRAEAGVSKPTLYSYFASKEDLFLGVVGELVEEHASEWLPATTDGVRLGTRDDLRAVLSDLALRAVDHLLRAEYVALARVVIAEAPQFPRLAEEFRAAVPARAIALVTAVLKRAREQGVVVIDDSEMASRLLIGPLLSFLVMDGLLVGEGEPHKPEPERVRALVDLYLKAVC